MNEHAWSMVKAAKRQLICSWLRGNTAALKENLSLAGNGTQRGGGGAERKLILRGQGCIWSEGWCPVRRLLLREKHGTQ